METTLSVDTREFLALRERVGLVQADVSHILDGQEKQNGYIKELADATKELTAELEEMKRTIQPVQFIARRSVQVLIALASGTLIAVLLHWLGV